MILADSAVVPTHTADELTDYLHRAFPGGQPEMLVKVEDVTDTTIRLRRSVSADNLRPGGTVSGPTLMMVADTVAYLMTLAQMPHGTDAVTVDLQMSFLRRPPLADLIGEGRLLRMGKRFSVVDVGILSEGSPDEVAHAMVTYAPLLG